MRIWAREEGSDASENSQKIGNQLYNVLKQYVEHYLQFLDELRSLWSQELLSNDVKNPISFFLQTPPARENNFFLNYFPVAQSLQDS